jgi:hypothetical protein
MEKDQPDYAVWIEIIDEERGIGRQWMAPRSFIDSMAETEEQELRKALLKRRAEAFTQRAILEFIMDSES